MAKLDPKSPDAIRIYLLLAGAVVGFLFGFFLIVPILKDTCTWFTARCSQVAVQEGDGNSLLVSVGPYKYYYDGVKYIYAYGDELNGSCPRGIASNLSPNFLPAPVQPNFCYRWKPTPDDPECLGGKQDKCAVCDQTLEQMCATACAPGGDPEQCANCNNVITQICARYAKPVGDGKFTCDGTTMLDAQECCNLGGGR